MGRALAVLIPALVAVAPFVIATGWILNPDGALYAALATSIRTGHGYMMPEGGFPVFRPPLMATVIAGGWMVGGPSIATAVATLRVFQVGLVVVASLLALRLAGGWAALLSGVLVASSPVLFRGVGAALRPDGMVAALAIGALLLLIRADDRRSVAVALIAGGVASIAFATKQTALMLLLVPFGMAALERIDRRLVTIWLAFLVAALVGPLIWYTASAANGSPPLGVALFVPLGWAGWLAAAIGLLWLGSRHPLPRRLIEHGDRLRLLLRIGSLMVFGVGLVAFTRVAGLDLVELPLRTLRQLPTTLFSDLGELLPTAWLVLPILAGAVYAFVAGRPWRYVVVAFVASLPIVAVAWWHELRDSQYMIPVVLGLVLAGSLPAGLGTAVLRRRTASPIMLRNLRLLVALVSVTCALAVALPMAPVAKQVYANARGTDAARYQAVVAAADWLGANAPPGSIIGYDDESVRQLWFELDARYPLSSTPQMYVRPDAGSEPLPLAPMAWVDKAGMQGTKPPPPAPPLIKLETARGGRHFVILEGERLLSWLTATPVAYLVVTDESSLGLASIEPYLERQPGLRRVFENDGRYHLVIYEVTPDQLVPIEYPLYGSPEALALVAHDVGSTPEALAALLNPVGSAAAR